MKMIKKILVIAIILILPVFINAQPIPPPSSNGLNGNQGQPGGGAPIDGGLSIFLLLGAAYGGKKVYSIRKLKQKD